MLKNMTNNTDLTAMLTGVKSGGAKKGTNEAALLELLGNGKQPTDFSQILQGEGALQELSGDELLAFFSKNMKGGDQSSLDALMARLESPQGQELLKSFSFDGKNFINAEGAEFNPSEMVKKLSEMQDQLQSLEEEGMVAKLNGFDKEGKSSKKTNNSKIQSAQDFLAQRKALGNKQVMMGKNQKPVINNMNSAVNQYQTESQVINNKLIKTPSAKSNLNMPQAAEVGSAKDSGAKIMNINPMEAAASGEMDLAQVLSMKEQGGGSDMPQSQSQVKMINLSQISANNKTELINQVSNYIEQSYVAGQNNVDMVVNHDELGQFRINATKVGVGNQIELEIQTMTKQGQAFFAENESELIKNLTKSGIKLSDFKVMNSSEIFSVAGESRSQTSDSSSQSQGRGDFSQNQGQRQFSSERDQGNQRRRQMWQQAQEYQQMMSA